MLSILFISCVSLCLVGEIVHVILLIFYSIYAVGLICFICSSSGLGEREWSGKGQSDAVKGGPVPLPAGGAWDLPQERSRGRKLRSFLRSNGERHEKKGEGRSDQNGWHPRRASCPRHPLLRLVRLGSSEAEHCERLLRGESSGRRCIRRRRERSQRKGLLHRSHRRGAGEGRLERTRGRRRPN